MKSSSRLIAASIALAMAACGSVLEAQQTSNYELRATPASSALKIDGDLKDWDLSGEILVCYDIATLKDTNSLRIATMYDADFLYLSFHFKDATPMVNNIDPVNELGGGWKSDSVELRVMSDQILNVEAWYYTAEARPTMWIGYGIAGGPKGYVWDAEIKEALKEGAKEAFKKDTDGKGYVQEMAIPWSMIFKGAKPAPGASFKMGIQVNWGKDTGRDWPVHRYADLLNAAKPQREFFWSNTEAWGSIQLSPSGNLQPSPSIVQLSKMEEWQALLYKTEGPIAISYDLPKDGFASIAIEKADGTRVRNLIGNYPRKAGRNTDYWDGADDNGQLVEAGEYNVRGIFHEKLDLIYDFSYGTPGNPPWGTPDSKGGWLSNHTNPMSVASDSKQVYFSAPFAEGATAVMAANGDGVRQWGIGNINGGMLASDGKYVYMLVGAPSIAWGGAPENEVAIVRIDATTGKYAPFQDGKQMHSIAKVPPAWQWQAPRRPAGELYAEGAFEPEWCQRQSMGLAYGNGKLYCSLFNQNEIIVVDAIKGETCGKLSIEKPTGLAIDQSGSLLAISGKDIVKFDSDGKPSTLVKEGLSAPIGLAISANGEIFVSDWGKAMCVKVFSKDGAFLRSIGKSGGRALEGAYDVSGMFRPWGLALDAKGNLWVAEHDSSPQRISVWDVKSGAFIKEFCGTTNYSASLTHVNQYKPSQAFILGNTCELDWEKGLWRVTGSYLRPSGPGALFDMTRDGWGSILDIAKFNGEEYLISSNYYVLCVSKLNKGGAKALAAIGLVSGLCEEGAVIPGFVIKGIMEPKRLEELKRKYPKLLGAWSPSSTDIAGSRQDISNRKEIYNLMREPGVKTCFQWTDQNGDGLIQETEISFLSKAEAGGDMNPGKWRPSFGPDLSLYLSSRSDAQTKVWRLPVREWNKAGAPVYDYKDAKLLITSKQRPGIGDCDTTWIDPSGNILLLDKPFQMYSPSGALLWTYPNEWPGVHGSHTAPQSKEGRLIGPLFIMGSASLKDSQGDVFCVNGNLGERYLMTCDGLFLANLFRDCRSAPDGLPHDPQRGMSLNKLSAGGEPFGGEFFLNAVNGKYYIGGPVDTCREASALVQVAGLETVKRLPNQTIKLTEAQAEEARRNLEERKAKGEGSAKLLAISKAKDANGNQPALDSFGWTHAAKLSFDARRSAEATWSFDDKSLHIAFRNVLDETPMVNGGRDWRTLFKTGDALEFELRTAADNNARDVIAGDTRLLISIFEGKPVAVLYRYKIEGPKTPVSFASPVGTAWIDEVKILDSALIKFERGGSSYSLVASVPLKELGFAPQPGKSYRGDFGVVYSDKAGQVDELRMYWANTVSGNVSDLFSEAQINPGNWGRFEVK